MNNPKLFGMDCHYCTEITLRDLFAGLIMPSQIYGIEESRLDAAANASYLAADAMLKAREATK